jgi:hypothetical protein
MLLGGTRYGTARAAERTAEVEPPKAKQEAEPSSGETDDYQDGETGCAEITQQRLARREDEGRCDSNKECD